MPVYSADTQTGTGTAVPNAGADNHIPTGGSAANWGSITSETFLAGPNPGQEQVLVKVGNQTAQVAAGERKHDVFKDATTHVNSGDNLLFYHKNRNTDVTLNDKLAIHGDNEIIVDKKRTVTVLGEQFVTVKKDHSLFVFDNIKEHADQTVTIDANRTITIDAGVELVLQGPGGVIKIDSKGITIQGVIVKIN
jgi:hypothetical protein